MPQITTSCGYPMLPLARKRPRIRSSSWKRSFPLFRSEDYDFYFPNLPWPVGLQSTMPEELIRKISAAMITHSMGNRSIDYTYKAYTKSRKYKLNDGSRLDTCVVTALNAHLDGFSKLLFHITTREPKSLGETVSEWTLIRIPHLVGLLVTCAHRGALYESAAIARMLLEQIAWAFSVAKLSDADAIRQVPATKAITRLSREIGASGKLYGWLSTHAHWEYNAHIKAMDFSNPGLAMLLATSRFKAIGLSLALVVATLSSASLSKINESYISDILNPNEPLAVKSLKTEFGEYKEPIDQVRKEIEETLNFVHIRSVLGRFSGFSSLDPDVQQLISIVSSLCGVKSLPG